MKITDILSPDVVVADLKGTTKPDVLNELAKALAAKYTEIKLAELSKTNFSDREQTYPAEICRADSTLLQ